MTTELPTLPPSPERPDASGRAVVSAVARSTRPTRHRARLPDALSEALNTAL